MNKEIARAKKVFKELAKNEVFIKLKDDPIVDKILEALLGKKQVNERIEVLIYPFIPYISATLRNDDKAKLIAAARSEYIAAISDDETTTCVYLAKLQ